MARKGQGIEILAGRREGLGGEDFLRALVQRTVQQVPEAEMTSFLVNSFCLHGLFPRQCINADCRDCEISARDQHHQYADARCKDSVQL